MKHRFTPTATAAPLTASPRLHSDTCEAEADHDHDCVAATELGRLRAFAEAVRDEIDCNGYQDHETEEAHLDDCLHCAAEQALERAK